MTHFSFESPPDRLPPEERAAPFLTNLDRFTKFDILTTTLHAAWCRDMSDHELSLSIHPFLQKIELDGHDPLSIPDYERDIYDQLAPLSGKELLKVCQQLLDELVASDRTCLQEEVELNGIKKSIAALTSRERNDLYILFLIADREGWSFWATNKEMGYFPVDAPLIEAIDRASRSPQQRLHFFYVFGGKSPEHTISQSIEA